MIYQVPYPSGDMDNRELGVSPKRTRHREKKYALQRATDVPSGRRQRLSLAGRPA